MAQRKISELPSLSTPDGAEELVVNDSGVSKKVTIANAVANTTPKIHTHTVSNITDAGNTATLDLGTISGTVSEGDHAHTGIYEAADVTILKDADIGVNVQAYDATIVVDADIGVNVQAYDATIVVDADIGSTVQAYDADTAKLDTDQSWTGSQRGTTVVDNDGSFDMNGGNNFKCTPTGAITLTFTNITNGQSGFILLVNSGQTVSAHANTKVDANLLATVTAAGTYLVSYFSDGTNVYLTNSAVYA